MHTEQHQHRAPMMAPEAYPPKVVAMIEQLRFLFGKVERLDPEGPAYAGLCRILDKASDAALWAVANADIKFASELAMNRVHRRGLAA